MGLCTAQVVVHGEKGKRMLVILPGVLFVGAMVVFPLRYAILIGLSDWNLASPDGRQFNGLDSIRQIWGDPFYYNALKNMMYYTLSIIVEYAISFGLALLLVCDIRARKFFCVAFLMPQTLSSVAVSWMVGKSVMEPRLGRWLGWDASSFFDSPEIARAAIMVMDARTCIPSR